ncbi:MAG TPA: protoporphyrinogen oxidase [Opitutaceae bacterium]|jgi:oxygen-dependent protoporphyrinogen oxidase|nr:protoporphyrinogen oxidase [Opitutaceae bacterium]
MTVAVLGGGVTGLTAAWRLSSAGHKVRLLEASGRLGGVVRSESADGWLAESGPVSIQESTSEISGVISELGLGPERLVSSPAAVNRYIVRKGALVAVPAPTSMAAFLATPLLSMRSKIAVGAEATRKPIERSEDVSVADMVRDHFGKEVLETLVQPLIGGIYAGDAEQLSARHAFPKIWEMERTFGSLIRAAGEASSKRKALGISGPPPIISFRKGLQSLTDAIASRLPEGTVSTDSAVIRLSQGKRSLWTVEWDGPNGQGKGDFDCVVAALPADALAKLEVNGTCPLAGLAAIEYPPVASMTLGYRRDKVRHPLDGFGALVPLSEKRTILGVLFASTLFPGRAPDGHVALSVFAGGSLQPENARLGRKALEERVQADLRDLLGAEGKPVFVRHAVWARAIPQYNLGYERHLASMKACEAAHAGLFIGGNVRDGISLPDCIVSGSALAKRVS